MDQTAPASAVAGRRLHAWEQYYPPGLDWGMTLRALTLPGLLAETVARCPDRPVLEYRERRFSYHELAAHVDRLAAGLLARGIGAGQTVALFLPNTPWHTVSFFAVLKTGARVAHLSPLDAPRELAHKLGDSGARVVITTDLGGLANGAARFVEAGLVDCVLVGEDAFWGGPASGLGYGGAVEQLDTLFSNAMPVAWPAIDADNVAVLQYTGGTTGMPKAAMLSHRNLSAAAQSFSTWRDYTPVPPGNDRVIAVLPMFHIYALTVCMLLPILDGSEILLRPRFDVQTTLRDIEEKRATAFPAVPTMLIALLAEPDIATRDFSSLHMLGSGGAPLPHEVALQVENATRKKLRGGWGMTETSPAGTRVPTSVEPTPGLIGVPLPGIEIRVVALDDPHRVLDAGETGELAIRGPNVFSGYWKQPALTAASFAGGFFLTGDIGRVDNTGLFTIVDRKKRMIISGGFNVYPNMIENAIYEHPDVAEVIVIGVADPYRGEAAKAFVKLKPGSAPLTLEALRDFLADRLGKHEMPAALALRDELPKSAVGKLLPSALQEEEKARAAFAGGAAEGA
jgi:long-chain acyl-CoA synthetase